MRAKCLRCGLRFMEYDFNKQRWVCDNCGYVESEENDEMSK